MSLLFGERFMVNKFKGIDDNCPAYMYRWTKNSNK